MIVGAVAIALLGKKKKRSRGVTCPDPGISQGSLAGLRFRQEMIGGAQAGQQVAIIGFFHARGVQATVKISFPSADRPARVLMPDSPMVNAKGGPLWFQGRAADQDQESLAYEMRAQASRAAAFVRAVRQCYPGVPVVVTGYSQGGMLTLAMGAMYPELANFLVPVSAWLPESMWPPFGFSAPIYGLHGASDETIPSDRSLTMYAAFEDTSPEVNYEFVAKQPGHGTKYLPWSNTIRYALDSVQGYS